jgi:hypothetical protein
MIGQENAETLALQALAWIAAKDELLGAFLGASGLAPDDLRRRAAEPEVLVSVLDFILAQDDTVLAFCAAAGVPPATLMEARAALPGGSLPHWT